MQAGTDGVYGKVALRGKVSGPVLRERSARGNSRYVVPFDCEREREVYALNVATGRTETVVDRFWLVVFADGGIDLDWLTGYEGELVVRGHLHAHSRGSRGDVVIEVEGVEPVS